MAKVYIDRDDIYEYFLWDQETLNLLDPSSWYKTTEVPDEFLLKYNKYLELRKEIQEELSKYHEI